MMYISVQSRENLLSNKAKHHISVQVDMDELDLTAAESKATYEEIQE